MEKATTYKTKASAKRAAKGALAKSGIDAEIVIHEVEGGFQYELQVQVPSKEFLRVSEIDSPCMSVWEIADEMNSAEQVEENGPAKRKDVIAKCVESGIAFYTARTQYQLWKQAGKASEKK